MAVPVTILPIQSGYDRSKVQTNFDNIQTALQDTVSRSGSAPNQMNADLDLNSHDLLNVGTLESEFLVVNGQGIFPETSFISVPDNSIGENQLINNSVGADKVKKEVALVYESADDLLSVTVPASHDVIGLAGDAIEGDDGGEPLLLVRSPGATVGYVLDASGAKWYNPSTTIRLSKTFHGADPSGSGNNTPAFLLAFAELEAKGGGKLIIPNGNYRVTASIQPPVSTTNLIVEWSAEAWIIAGAGMAETVFRATGGSSATGDLRIKLINPQIDCSAGSSLFGIGNDWCQAIQLDYWATAEVIGGYLYGGEAPDNVNADSGVSTVANRYTLIDGTRIRGFNDAGIYVNGDNTVGAVGDGIEVKIRNVSIERCNVAITGKRELYWMTVSNSFILECTAGIVASEVTAPNVGPVRRMDVYDNRFKKLTANIVRFRGPTKGSFQGNTVEDWGYRYDGTGNVGTSALAVVIQGSSGINVKNNEFKMVEWASVSEAAAFLDNITIDGVPYTQGGHVFVGNTYRNLNRVIAENPGGNGSHYVDEVYESISGNKFSANFNTASVVTYRNVGDSRLRFRSGSQEYPYGPRRIIVAPAGATLLETDSGNYYTNAGATTRADFTLPPASIGLTFEFSCMDTDGIRIIANAGDQIRSAGVASAVAGRIDNAVVGTYIKLTAQDSTNWVAEGGMGTWTVT